MPDVPPELYQALHAAFTSELRLRLLLELESREWTGVELADHLGVRPTTVRNHLVQLERARVITEVRRDPRRGGAVAVYRAATGGWAALIEASRSLAVEPDAPAHG